MSDQHQRFSLRPASSEEAGLFYSQDEKDAELGTVGHLRVDFGRSGSEFWSTWWPHNGDTLNTPEFKLELQTFVDKLRKTGPLSNLSAMSEYCCGHSDGRLGDCSRGSYGYVAESEHYRYCLRCTPIQGDYNAYLYIYDKRQQEMSQLQKLLDSEQDLPEMCFSTLSSDGSLICIKHGETGYYKSLGYRRSGKEPGAGRLQQQEAGRVQNPGGSHGHQVHIRMDFSGVCFPGIRHGADNGRNVKQGGFV